MKNEPGPFIAISAPANGSGKTSLLCRILESLPTSLVAVKSITIYRNGSFCPVFEGDCACRRLTGEFEIVRDSAVLRQEGTDTQLMWESGAKEVFWGLAREGHHDALWARFREVLPAGEPVIFEGTQIVEVIQPRLRLFVFDPTVPSHRFKASASAMIEAADVVVVNHRSNRPAEEGLQWLRERRSDSIEADLSRPLVGSVRETVLGRIAEALHRSSDPCPPQPEGSESMPD